mmetsp:Transcript_14396/g.26513  ORF Transcript_14396/g.26513 Transcript_14396/m.26513 type:complete len:242 (-) Transcript_14396:102-827(-)
MARRAPSAQMSRRRLRGALLLGIACTLALRAAALGFCGVFGAVSRPPLESSRVAVRAEEEGGPLDAFLKDDGRVLDEGSPAGAIGSVAIALVVLPYIPVSLFSSWALLTTGSGIDPGPGGLYGLIEGISSLSVLSICIWSLTSFLTRARGLPGGLFSLLGTTQALCFLCVFAFAAASLLNATENPFLNKTPDEIQELAKVKLTEAGGVAKGELEKQLTEFNPAVIAEALKSAASQVKPPPS